MRVRSRPMAWGVRVISELPARWSRLIARFLSGHDLRAVPGVSGIGVFAAYGVTDISGGTRSGLDMISALAQLRGCC
jgi:hypothetical protein